MTFDAPRKYIFFPGRFQKKIDPRVIFVTGEFEEEWRGSDTEQEVREGRFAYYPKSRCQPYSDRLMFLCREWIARRDSLASEYLTLMKKGSTPNADAGL
jgi:hypothetical protein